MKNITRIILLILIVSTMLFTAVSCKGTPEIAVKEDAMPQLVHVLGEELDLSKGVLVVNQGKKTEEIAMNAEGVEISGYDKNQLGEQTVTVSYNGASTTVTVTVVERMQVVDYVSDYLVGDAFDTSKGRLRITKNDGTSYTVILNNAAVSIEGFDTSSAANGKTVTAKYTGTNESYETTFTVNVHAIDDITLQAPKKTAYSSHETGLNLDGGRIVLSGNNGTLKKEIKLTDTGITIEGFDLSVVNEENTSATQKINVIYDGVTYSYDIKISYTSVSMFNDHAHEFAGIDWESETVPTIDAELGEFALELMDMYVQLSTADAILISDEDLLNVARVAVVYGYDAWLADVVKFEGAFNYAYDEYYESYSIFVTCNTYDDVANAIVELKKSDRDLYRMYEQLVKIFEIESIYDQIIEYIATPIIGDTMFTSLIPMFEHMIKLHDIYLPMLPASWQTEGYETYENAIVEIYEFILDSSYIEGENSWIYEQVAYWYDSENTVKTFDAFYLYYFAQNDTEALYNLANITLPSYYLDLVTKLDGLMTLLDSIEAGDVYDNTTFFYDYYAFVEYAKEYEFSEDELIAFIYSELPVNILFGYDESDDIYIGTLVDYLYYGYAQIASTLIELPAFENLMDDYLGAFVIAKNNDNYLADPAFTAYIEGMMGHFLELTTTQQNLFFGAIMPYYYYGAPEFAFSAKDDEARYVAAFINYVLEYYQSIFENENADIALKHLLTANEIYSRRFDLETWEYEFDAKMTAFNEAFNLLSGDEKDNFDSYLGGLRIDCEKVLARLDAGKPTFDAYWQGIFDELTVAIRAMDDASYAIEEGILDSEGYYFYNVFLAAYERAQKLINIILSEDTPDAVKDAYYHELMYTMVYEYDDGSKEYYHHTFEYAFSGLRGYYVLYRIYTAGSSADYENYFGNFFDLAYDIIVPYFNSMLYSDVTIDITNDQLVEIMNAYSKLSPLAKAYHLLMEGGVFSTYNGAIHLYSADNYSAGVAKIISAITELEYAHSFYYYYTEVVIDANPTTIQKSLDDVQNVFNNLLDLYEDLSEEELIEFAPFDAIYDYYVDLTQKMIEANEATI